ncbi:hypothetical protein [Intestinibacter sp.]
MDILGVYWRRQQDVNIFDDLARNTRIVGVIAMEAKYNINRYRQVSLHLKSNANIYTIECVK